MQSLKLNLGCGDRTPEGWINVDYALGAKLAKIPFFPLINSKLKIFNLSWNPKIFLHDLRQKFPWSDEQFDCIYSSHTLEHLSKHQGRYFLQECYRVLNKNGTIRIVVPDLKDFVKSYIHGDILAEDFIEKLEVWYDPYQTKNIKNTFHRFFSFPHQCMYDTDSLIRTMSSIGFHCQSKKPFESEIDDINIIELPDRTKAAVIVEGKK